MDKKNIAILYICTGQYFDLFENFYRSIKTFFLPQHNKTFFVWSDSKPKASQDIVYMPKQWKPYPHALMHRYDFFLEAKEHLKNYDYCFFFNANALCIKEVDEDVLPIDVPFVAAEQYYQFQVKPGKERFDIIKDQYWTDCPQSPAFIPLSYWKDNPTHCWLMGGFNGGKSIDWIQMSEQISEWVEYNNKYDLTLKWHDEPFMNKYMIDHGVKRLNPIKYLNWQKSTWDKEEVKIVVTQKKELLSNTFRVSKVHPKRLLNRLSLTSIKHEKI